MKLIYHLIFLFIMGCLPSAATLAQQLPKNTDRFKVVINHEEQYSIWPVGERATKDWKDTRITGNLKQCQQYIEEVWTDMRPLSIRKAGIAKNGIYNIIINHEEQYSIWPEDRPLPRSWKKTGKKGNLAECMIIIEEVWTDMRPLSMRKRK